MNIPLSYDPATGVFTWLKRPRMARRAMAGDRAGTINSHGYVVIAMFGKKVKAHRLAWFMTHGEWPSGQIDHINGDRADNRLANLRDVSHALNVHNRRSGNRNSQTGILGVSPAKGGFVATISVDGVHHHLGSFAEQGAAEAAYRSAKAAMHAGYIAAPVHHSRDTPAAFAQA